MGSSKAKINSRRTNKLNLDLERIINNVVINSYQYIHLYVCNDGSVTARREECRDGVLVSFFPKDVDVDFDFDHPLVDRVSEAMERITGNESLIHKEKIVYDVYLGDLIPLGETTAHKVKIMAYTTRKGSTRELREEGKRLVNELRRRVPEVAGGKIEATSHKVDYFIVFDNEAEHSDKKITLDVTLAFPSREMLDIMRLIWTSRPT